MPDPSLLLRAIAGETVFGLDVDSRIRYASNSMTARLLVDLFQRCDDTQADWVQRFTESLDECKVGGPDLLMGLDDGRAGHEEALDENDGSLDDPGEAEGFPCYLKLVFTNAEAAYYQFPLFPALNEPFVLGAARMRESEFQHLRVDLRRREDLQRFIEGLRVNPHLVAVEESSEEVFGKAPSHAV